MTFVLVSREVDLSVGSAYAFASLITGLLIVKAWLLVPALIVGLAAGSAIGLINGLLSTYGKLPSFIATLGMLSVIRGAALLITDGQPVTVDVDKGAKPDVIPVLLSWSGAALQSDPHVAGMFCGDCDFRMVFTVENHVWFSS